MKTTHKPRQSTSKPNHHFVRDSKMILASTLLGFILLGVANASAVSYKIVYDDNVVNNMPEDVKSTTMNNSEKISSETPTRDGYTFLKWCSQLPASDGTCPGTEYSPDDPLAISGTSKNEYNLYAMWEQPKDISTATYMQEVTSCPSTLTTGQVYTLKDNRDDATYHVAKLADNKCWMLDNLALDPTAVTLDKLKGNTNASDTTLGYLKNGGSSPYSSAGVISTSSFGTSGTAYTQAKINTASKTKEVTSYGSGNKQVGVYYNYCAASAGSWCYASNTPSSDPDTSTIQDVKEDICPSGWRMPTGGSSGEYRALYAAYSSNATNFKTALSTPLSGRFYDSSADDQGSYGFFWSSTYYGGYGMYGLYVDSSDVDPALNGSRDCGNSVRCVAQ